MATNVRPLIPAVATHPGTILKKELKARGIKQKDFALAINMPAPNLSELIKGKRNITDSIAIKLEEALGIPFQNWMNLQNQYNYVTKTKEQFEESDVKALAEEQSLRSRLNMNILYKYYEVCTHRLSDKLSALKNCLAIDLNELQRLEVNTVGFFKRSEKLKFDEINMRTWLLIAWSEAMKTELQAHYSPEKGMEAAVQIAKMANERTLTTSLLAEILNEHGIIYIHVPKLETAPIDAYSMMTSTHPAIVVTYRHNDLDKLAFDVLHEIGHIQLHIESGKSFISVENEYSSQSKEERDADQFANDLLISPNIWAQIMSSKPNNITPYAVVHTIAKEAERNSISPSIAVARYKHDTNCYNIRGYRSPKITDSLQ